MPKNKNVHLTNIANIFTDYTIVKKSVDDIRIDQSHPRKVTEKQKEKAARLIHQTGFIMPVIIDEKGHIVIGQEWYEGAKIIGLEKIPVIITTNLTDVEIRLIRIGYPKIQELGEFDHQLLAAEFMSFFKLDIDLRITGFDTPEIDIIMTGLPSSEEDVRDNLLPPATKGPPATKIGDLWILGDHRLYCGSATCLDSYHILMGEEKATAIISDPPFNCKNEGHTGGKGKIKHENFIECYGEKSEEGFTDFLTGYLGNAASVLVEGGLGYSFMDWRNQYAMLTAIRRAHLIQINLVIWNKNNGAMGSFYRSKHEMVHVFKKGSASHINNVELGKHGRYRTNVWDYAGINTFRPGRLDELSMHPTVKPVAMIADAIMDCTNKGDIVLDPFMGSGTIFIACEKTGRSAYAMDLDPIYVDTAIRRWQKYTGKDAIHAGTGRSFAEIITAGGINE